MPARRPIAWWCRWARSRPALTSFAIACSPPTGTSPRARSASASRRPEGMALLAGFLDVLLRGVGLLALCAAVGGVTYGVIVLRALGRGASTAAEPLRRVLGLATLGALVLAGSRGVVLFVLHPWVLADAAGRWPVAQFAATDFGHASLIGIALALAFGATTAGLRGRPTARAGWLALVILGAAVLANSGWLAHAVSRLEGRGGLMLVTVLHQTGAVLWIGGLMHLARSWRAPLPPEALGRTVT